MIVRSLRFLDLETPVESFNTWLRRCRTFLFAITCTNRSSSTLRIGDWPWAEKSTDLAPSRCRSWQSFRFIPLSTPWNARATDVDFIVRKSLVFSGRKER